MSYTLIINNIIIIIARFYNIFQTKIIMYIGT